MKNLKTVPFAEYLDDVRNNDPKHTYLGFISRDRRLVAYEGISYAVDFLAVKYNDGSTSVNRLDGTCPGIYVGFEQELIDRSHNDLFAIYEDKI